jgi:chaperonin GroES
MAKTTTKKPLAIIPLGDKVLIKPSAKVSEARTEAGIIVPGTSGQEKHERGKIIAVGKGRVGSDGKRIPVDLEIGAQVMFIRGYDYQEFTVGGEDYVLTGENNVLAVMK